jgi:hypothetical protein
MLSVVVVCRGSYARRRSSLAVAAGVSDPDYLLRNTPLFTFQAAHSQQHLSTSRQTLWWRIDRTHRHREVSGRRWESHGCAASVGANRDRRSRRGPASRVSPHIVDLKVCVVILRRPWPNHIVVVLHTGHGHKKNPLNPSRAHARSGR